MTDEELLRGLPSPFRLALSMARKSLLNFKVGAVVCRSSTPISAGFNQRKSHPYMHTLDYGDFMPWGLHGEMHACWRMSVKLLRGSEIYVFRLRRDGKVGLAKPCEHCHRFLVQKGIVRAHFTLRDGGFDSIRLRA